MEFPKFSENNTSLVATYLTKAVFNSLKNKQTSSGYTLQQVIASGVENKDSSIGAYAGDAESYTVFADLFNPIIEAYHGFTIADTHKSDVDISKFTPENPDKEGTYILSTRIRIARNLAEYPLGANSTLEERREVEHAIVSVLEELDGEFSGNYFPLYDMPESVQNTLIKDHFLFKEGDRFLASAGLNNDWPAARGIYHNKEKTFLVWVNEEDQLRIISMQKGGDLQTVFKRLMCAIQKIEEKISFSKSTRLGYITSCPTNLGTAMRASVHICLPKLSKNSTKMKEIVTTYNLQIRGVDGEHSQSKNSTFDISNKRRLGITEIEAMNELYDGIVALIDCEKQ